MPQKYIWIGVALIASWVLCYVAGCRTGAGKTVTLPGVATVVSRPDTVIHRDTTRIKGDIRFVHDIAPDGTQTPDIAIRVDTIREKEFVDRYIPKYIDAPKTTPKSIPGDATALLPAFTNSSSNPQAWLGLGLSHDFIGSGYWNGYATARMHLFGPLYAQGNAGIETGLNHFATKLSLGAEYRLYTIYE